MEKESIDPSLTTLRGMFFLVRLLYIYGKYLISAPVWITIFHATAIFSTLFRLCYRLSMHRWWYEDWFAAIGLVADINSFISVWIYTYPWTGAWVLVGINLICDWLPVRE
jgi:hypothetical protein